MTPPQGDSHLSSQVESERVTQLLRKMGYDPKAREAVFQAMYSDLRAIARSLMRGQRRDHSLGSVGLVHEAYLKLIRIQGDSWESRRHFCRVAVRAMRSILVDHARAKGRAKRTKPEEGVLDEVLGRCETRAIDLILLNEALDRLAETNERWVKVVELRFLAGRTREEAAGILGVSSRTVERDWKEAREWLRKTIGKR